MALPCPQSGAPQGVSAPQAVLKARQARITQAVGLFSGDRLAVAAHRVQFQQQERVRATDALVHAEIDFLTTLAERHRAGVVTWAQLDAAYRLVAYNGGFAAPGGVARWKEIVGVPRSGMIAKVQEEAVNSDGAWSGHTPLEEGEFFPPDDQSVVYLLFDVDNVPVYVGSTARLKTRLAQHQSDKVWTQWVAYRCENRQAAYELETRYLRQYKPRYNKIGAPAASSGSPS